MNSNFRVMIAGVVLLLLFCLHFSSTMGDVPASGKLRVGFYARTCPHAEIIVRRAVNKAVSRNPGLAAALIRMHFHDCFVRGCDGSVLLDTVPGAAPAEKDNLANFPSLQGYEVIDEAKALIEATCPQTVSCADILAFAARDSALKVGNIRYDVPSGRRDGRVSLSSEVLQNLPPPFFNATQLRDNFKNKGLSLNDMVTLSGAHSIGVAHCSTFSNRLSRFNATFDQDPSMDPGFAAFLKRRCLGKGDPAVANDFQTPARLDSWYYKNLINRRGVFTSDQTLFDSPLTRNQVIHNAKFGNIWGEKFGAAMVRMGNIQVLTGKQGEIRKKCRFVN